MRVSKKLVEHLLQKIAQQYLEVWSSTCNYFFVAGSIVRDMQLTVENTLKEHGLLAGVVTASPVGVHPASAQLRTALEELIGQHKEVEFPVSTKEAVRGLLKTGGFKPSGRNKPASEYLAQAAREGRFPSINNLVDVNNLISLSSGLPISLLDGDAVGTSLMLRYGREGERYVFNSSGQDIDLTGLICACCGESDTPLGNPVKDSMTGKIKDSTNAVIGIIYAPNTPEWLETTRTQLNNFANWLGSECGATVIDTVLV